MARAVAMGALENSAAEEMKRERNDDGDASDDDLRGPQQKVYRQEVTFDQGA